MYLVEVNNVNAKSVAASVRCTHDMASAKVEGPNLRCYDYVLTVVSNCFTEDFLGFSSSVNFRCVNEVDA